MAIKKMYKEIYDLLEANQSEKVRTVMKEVLELITSKRNRTVGNAVIKNTEGEVVAINCYYFKRWMPIVGVCAVEFGIKKSTATGFNAMCKEGLNHWTTQNNAAKKAHNLLLDRLESGELATNEISSEKARIEKVRLTRVGTDLGFAEQDEVETYLDEMGVIIDEN